MHPTMRAEIREAPITVVDMALPARFCKSFWVSLANSNLSRGIPRKILSTWGNTRRDSQICFEPIHILADVPQRHLVKRIVAFRCSFQMSNVYRVVYS